MPPSSRMPVEQSETTQPAWLRDECGCCAGIQWGGETPVECRGCGGIGMVFVSERDRIADYPGGPPRGMDPGRFALVKARLEESDAKCSGCKGKGYIESWQPIAAEPWRTEPSDTAACVYCAGTGGSRG